MKTEALREARQAKALLEALVAREIEKWHQQTGMRITGFEVIETDVTNVDSPAKEFSYRCEAEVKL